MTTSQLALDKKAYPLMMHLSILSKYDDISAEQSISYESSTQTSNITSTISCTWAVRKGSSAKHWPHKPDDDRHKGD